MKQVKKLLSLVLAMMLVLAMGSTVMAQGTTPPEAPETTIPGGDNAHTITIMNENEGHTYGAYQIFSGTFYEGKLSNIDWGKNIDGDGLLADLIADDTFVVDGTNLFDDCDTAEKAAGVLASEAVKNNSAMLEAFAKWADGRLKGDAAGTSAAGTAGADKKIPYTINVIGDGYYLVKDIGTGAVGGADAFTKYILQVVGNVEVDAKAEAPSLSKKIVDADGNEITMNDVNVGDTIPFKLTFKVPAMYTFDRYTAIVRDNAGDGLTFNNDPVITIGGATLVRGTDYDVVAITITGKDADGKDIITRGDVIAPGADVAVADGQDFQIEFRDLIAFQEKYKFNTGDEVVITYSSTVNENALLTMEGNKNEAKLIYSNDPKNPDNPTGETPSSDTTSYIAGIRLKKVDGDGNSLTGAQFTLSGESLKKVQETGIKFVTLAEAGEYTLVDNEDYYLLNDGKTYTSTKPTDDNSGSYADTETIYKKVKYTKYEDRTEQKTATAWVDENGLLTFAGLGEGKYTITEMIAPDGYNLLKEPLYIEIEFVAPTEEGKAPVWNAYYTDKDGNRLKDGENDKKINYAAGSDNMFELEITNQSGATLPSTGGIGTTIFYVLGGILVVGAGIMLVVKKRMSSEK